MRNDGQYWLVTASAREYRALAAGLGGASRPVPSPGHPEFFHLRRCSVALLYTGMGSRETARHLAHLLANNSCAGLVSVGYCGALRHGLGTGEIVLYSECGPLQRNGSVRIWFRPSFPFLSVLDSCLRSAGCQARVQRAVTSPGIISGAGQKRLVGERTGASVVDMETSEVFQLAHRSGVPRAAVRVVLDTVSHSLEGIEQFLDERGQFAPDAGRRMAVKAPRLALALREMERQASARLQAVSAALGEGFCSETMVPDAPASRSTDPQHQQASSPRRTA